jgi:WhiB family redox-sensing transcriptional regulator
MVELLPAGIDLLAIAGCASRPEWMTQASRRAFPLAWWFVRPGRARRTAVRICTRCPVRPDCLAYALEQPDDAHGVWGGLTMEERTALRRLPRIAEDVWSQTA